MNLDQIMRAPYGGLFMEALLGCSFCCFFFEIFSAPEQLLSALSLVVFSSYSGRRRHSLKNAPSLDVVAVDTAKNGSKHVFN